MPHLEYFLVSESISVDQISNRISLFHVFEERRSPNVPFYIAELVVTSAWDLDGDDIGQEIQTSVRITVPGRAEPVIVPQPFVAERSRHRINLAIIGLEVLEFGELLFEILLNGEHRASHRVSIIQMEPNQGLVVIRPSGPPAETPDRR